MLINRIPEEENGRVGDAEIQDLGDNSNELQTADEIYQIMAKNNTFDGDGDKAVTARDLVILYKSIDTKLVSSTNQQTSKCPNQYVETVIYQDDRGSEGSDMSQDISDEDFNHVFAINEERMDLLNNFGDTLCHKLGDMQMHTSDLNTEYNRHFLFNDPFIKEQLKSFHKTSKQSDTTVLPASLMDYICCKRIEDNYSFYMDNIIKYVQTTIDQLKRISNGDYLTEKAKEKWRTVHEGIDRTSDEKSQNKKAVLASSVTIPLRVKDKRTEQQSTWDDIVHSEMDVRYLSKILEKKIIVQIPKILCGTYKLFGKHCKENLIITCKQSKCKKSRLDVVLKLQRSKSGHIISNFNSIMVSKSPPTITIETETRPNELLALEFNETLGKNVTVDDIHKLGEMEKKDFELDKHIQSTENQANDLVGLSVVDKNNEIEAEREEKRVEAMFSDDDDNTSLQCDLQEVTACSSNRAEADFNTIAAGELYSTIHRLSMQSPVLEETEDNSKKKKSPMKVRIKSPYENKSFVIEEKKRKKLLEIREKREIKKNIINENCKTIKPKYGKSANVPQASNSVTKLSITNKHFYSSIYGHSVNIVDKNSRKFHKDQIKGNMKELNLQDDEETHNKDSNSPSTATNSQKYINRSYYLDDADTEVMHLQRKERESQDLTKDVYDAQLTNVDDVNLNLLEQSIVPSTTDFSLTDTSSSLQQNVLYEESFSNNEKENTTKNILMSTISTQVSVPTNSPKIVARNDEKCKTTSSVECRRSIDKIYNLIKEVVPTKSKITNNNIKLHMTYTRGSSSAQASDSGTSIKHQLTSSNPSCCSFDKVNTTLNSSKDRMKEHVDPMSIIPKVTISSKRPNDKIKNKHDKKDFEKQSNIIQENPLKAISQLIREFDNVQKKIVKKESKKEKKSENVTAQDQNNFIKRSSKQGQNLKDSDVTFSKNPTCKEKRRQNMGFGPLRITQQQLQREGNQLDTNRKKITDIIDEVKELKGEAVRGPSKNLARLNSLAQPKKLHLQIQQLETQNKFGKRVSDRLYIKPTSVMTNPDKIAGSARIKLKKIFEGPPVPSKQPHTARSPTEKLLRPRQLFPNSPSRDGNSKFFQGAAEKPPRKHGHITKTPEQLKGKMVAVETYVKSHFGRELLPLDLADSHNAHKSRVPLIPIDLDMTASSSSRSTKEESTSLGKKLHSMIDTMISSTNPVLGSVAECNESLFKLGNDLNTGSKSEEVVLPGGDYPVDILEDKNIAGVSAISKSSKDGENVENNESKIKVSENNKLYSSNELHNIENTLCRQLSNGSFQNPLKLKQLTLVKTPRQSAENLLYLQSEDSNSLILKSTLSQNIDITKETLKKVDIFPALSNNHFTEFGFYNFPMQIATVGYVLPHYVKCDSENKTILSEEAMSQNNENGIKQKNMTTSKLNIPMQIQFKDSVKRLSQETLEKESVICQRKSENEIEVIVESQKEYEHIEQKTQDVAETQILGEIVDADINRSNIKNSTSFDILVGLLNEIKKITSYQGQIPKQTHACDTEIDNNDLEIILDKVAVKESSEDNVYHTKSLHCIDNYQVLETRVSNSFYLSSNINVHKAKSEKSVTTLLYEPLSVDNEINPQIWQTECKQKFTEPPTKLYSISVSTSVTDSFIRLINNNSSDRSLYITDCESFASITNEIEEIPLDTYLEKSGRSSNPPILKTQYPNECGKYKNINTEQNNYSVIEFDSVMKMKRDILVTVYSILVFTVFAALSFPGIMYRV